MKAEYVNHMGDDLMVVNAARVSFDKEVYWDTNPYTCNYELSGRDTKLIKYLANHGHWTPFAHPQITLRMTAPVFVRTQCFKHKVGFTENEVSRRYVDAEPTFFVPDGWRQRADNKKQGSSDETLTHVYDPTCELNLPITPYIRDLYSDIIGVYHQLLNAGVAPEQARMILPQSMYTQWYWTGSLAAYARFYKQRTDDHAQKEIQDLAKMVGDVIQPLFPVSWSALTT